MGISTSSILIGFSSINHPFWGTPIFWKHPYGSLQYCFKLVGSTSIQEGRLQLDRMTTLNPLEIRSGIHVHPKWYPGLSATSSFSDFQAGVFSSLAIGSGFFHLIIEPPSNHP